MKSALATRPADEARIRTYRDDLAEAMREDHEAIVPDRVEGTAVAIVLACAAAVFVGSALIAASWLLGPL